MLNTFNINTDKVVSLTNKLEKLHKSAMPVAVRMTLNDAAFDMKQIQIGRQFKGQFTIRKKNFIRSHTVAVKSKNTFSINQMSSSVGVIRGKSNAGDDLEKQEHGGRIPKRDYIPVKEARVSGSSKKVVSKKYYLKTIKPKKGKSVYKSQNFIKAAFKVGKGGFIRYGSLLFEIRTIRKKGRAGLFLKTKPVYSFKKGRTVKIKRQPFMAPASKFTVRKMPKLFLKNAKKRFEKYML